MHRAGLAFLILGAFACRGGSTPSDDTKGASTPAATTSVAAPKVAAATTETSGLSGKHRADEQDENEWVPAEFKKGIAKFRDPGVYVDGKPIGFLRFAELPVPLKVWWHKERAAIPFGPNHKGPRYKIVKQRRYRFTDYLEAMKVDVSRVKELHIYGGAKRRIAVVVTGDQLRKRADFGFRFGSEVRGKPIPACPLNIADGNCPDNILSLAVYIDKEPPERRGGYFYRENKRIFGIPYFGEPLRGGIHVYLDGPMVAQIKRRKLEDASLKVPSTDGKDHWSFAKVLESQGVDTSKVVEGWIIHNNRRTHRIGRDELLKATFTASSQRKGQILFGAQNYPAKAIALHTKRVRDKDLPVVQPHELD